MTEITSISVTNFKGVKHISINPDGKNLVVIAGANGAGKSSFIDAVAEIFDPSGTRLTPKPIRNGETKATSEVVTTNARIVRTWTKNDAGSLAAYALDGAKYPSGKAFVLEATGGALFDPSEFVGLSEKDQRAQLLEKVKLPFDLAALDAKARQAYDERTDANREVKRLTALINSLNAPAQGMPDEEVSAASIIEEYDRARSHNDALSNAATSAASYAQQIVNIDGEIASLEARIEQLKRERDATELRRQDAVTDSQKSARIDLDEITARLDAVEDTNAKVRAAKSYAATAADLKAATVTATGYDKTLEEIEATKLDGLSKTEFPVEGMSVDEQGITVNGIPFKQINSGMQDVIALNLATYEKPDLRIVIMKNGDRLDKISLTEADRIASERGYLVLVERDRDESREIGFTIIDGELAA
jgi:energy-coupling factor transporter ATP-binding protein EcfA2